LTPNDGWAAPRAERSTDNRPAHRWYLTETRNFRIYSFGSRKLDPQVAAQCEAARSRLVKTWFAADKDQPWRPKCALVLHGSRASYRSAVGRLADCTVASCTIDAIGETTTKRRIDVCATCAGWLEYLPHELTHVLIDGRLTTGDLARWADEGMALVADPANKRAAHEQDLLAALRSGRQLRMVELLQLADYPQDDRLGVFYGQSLSVVEFLLDRGGEQKFVEFVKRSTRNGYDSALQSTYDIANVALLESLWLAHTRQMAAARELASAQASQMHDGENRDEPQPSSSERHVVLPSQGFPAG